MRRWIALGRADAVDYAILADALRRAGALGEARQAVLQAQRLDPANTGARTVLDQIAQSERVLPAAELERFAGLYSSPFGPLEIRSDGRRLTAHLLDQSASPMLPPSQTSFVMEDPGIPIEFVAGPSVVATHAIVRARSEMRLPRVGGDPLG